MTNWSRQDSATTKPPVDTETPRGQVSKDPNPRQPPFSLIQLAFKKLVELMVSDKSKLCSIKSHSRLIQHSSTYPMRVMPLRPFLAPDPSTNLTRARFLASLARSWSVGRALLHPKNPRFTKRQ